MGWHVMSLVRPAETRRSQSREPHGPGRKAHRLVNTTGRWLASRCRSYCEAVFSLDLRSVALFRVGLGLVTIWDFAERIAVARGLYSGEGAYSFSGPALLLRAGFFSFHRLHPSPAFQVALFAVGVIAAVALTIGYRARLAALILYLLVLSAQHHNPFVLEGFDIYHRVLLMWSMFLPLGSRFSIGGARHGRPDCRAVVSAGSMALTLQIVLIYVFNGLNKWNDFWLSGHAVNNTFAYLYFPTPVAHWLLGFPDLLTRLSHATLVLELGFPLLLLIPLARLWVRSVFVFGLAAFHLAIWVCLDVGLYSPLSICALALFLPSELWDRSARAFRKPAGTPAETVSRGETGVRLSAPLSALALLLLAYVAFHNVCDTFHPPAMARLPASVQTVVRLFRLQQRWRMFFRTPETREWPVLVGLLSTGRAVTVPDAREIDAATPLPAQLPQLPSHRWEKYFLEIGKGGKKHRDLRRRFALYWCTEWRPELSVSALELRLVRYSADSGRNDLVEVERVLCPTEVEPAIWSELRSADGGEDISTRRALRRPEARD